MELFEDLLGAIFLLSIGIEILLHITWNSSYFRIGIPIFKYECQCTTPNSLPLVSKDFEESIPKPSFLYKIVVRELSSNEFAFRDAFIPSNSFHYPPIMRGNLQITPLGMVRVVGLINWYVIASIICFVGLGISRLGTNNTVAIVFICGILLFWIVPYFIQRSRWKAAAIAAASLSTNAQPLSKEGL